jgi:hypothetical protein
MKVSLDPLDREPIVVKERLPFSWEKLAMGQRYDPPLLGMFDRFELGGYEEDLPHAVVVVALSILDDFAGAGISKARRRVGSCGRTQEVGERRHREVHDEEPPRRQMRANVREEALHIVARVEVQGRVERACDEREAPMQTNTAHVATPDLDPRANLAGLGDQALAEIREHCGRVVDPRDLDPMTRQGKRDSTVADPVLEHGTAEALREADVELNVVDPPPIRRGVVVGVGVVRERARFELAVTGYGRARRRRPRCSVLPLRAATR